MTSRDILVEANSLIEDSYIVRHAFAEDADGRAINHLSDKAVAFCPCGALVRAARNLGEIPCSELSEPLKEAMYRFAFIAQIPPGMAITQWADAVSEERIRAAFNEAALIADLAEADQLALAA